MQGEVNDEPVSGRNEILRLLKWAFPDWQRIYTFWILAITGVFILVMWDIIDSGAFVIGMTVALFLLAYPRFEVFSSIVLIGIAVIYNLNPEMISFIYVGCYTPIVMQIARRRVTLAFVTSAATLFSVVIYWGVAGEPGAALLAAVCLVLAWVFGTVLQTYNDRIRVEEARASEAETAAKLEAAEFAKVIAREMHDAVAHSMSSVILRARAASTRPELSEESKADLAEITDLSLQSLAEMRALLRLLRGNNADEARYRDYKVIDPDKELGRQVQHLKNEGFHVNMIQEGGFEGMDPLALSTLIACMREAVANTVRHGSTEKPIILTVNADDTRVSVALVNTIDEAKELLFPSSGLGLIGIRERLEAIGGMVSTSSGSGRWLLTFSLPKRIRLEEQGERREFA